MNVGFFFFFFLKGVALLFFFFFFGFLVGRNTCLVLLTGSYKCTLEVKWGGWKTLERKLEGNFFGVFGWVEMKKNK